MKKYVIIESPEVDIDFSQIDQDEIYDYLWDRLNMRFVISYDGDMPETIQSISAKSQEYTKEEIVHIMADPDWAIYDQLSENDIQEYQDHIDFYNELL